MPQGGMPRVISSLLAVISSNNSCRLTFIVARRFAEMLNPERVVT